jgi:hypothetical protein
MGEPRVIAEIREYGDFTAAIRKWILELDTTYECIDEIAGLQDRYLSKLIAKTPVRNFGPITLSPVLGALGLKLLLVIDTEKLAKLRPRYVARKKHAHDGVLRKEWHYLRGNSAYMSMLRHKGVLMIPPRRRRAIARVAALARWGNGARHDSEAPPVR